MSIKTTKNIEGKFDTLAEAEEFLDRILEDNGDQGLQHYHITVHEWPNENSVWTVGINYSWDVV